ncbi:hypothetical protein C8R46DRAFT_1362251, partial [Mycena filopes]
MTALRSASSSTFSRGQSYSAVHSARHSAGGHGRGDGSWTQTLLALHQFLPKPSFATRKYTCSRGPIALSMARASAISRIRPIRHDQDEEEERNVKGFPWGFELERALRIPARVSAMSRRITANDTRTTPEPCVPALSDFALSDVPSRAIPSIQSRADTDLVWSHNPRVYSMSTLRSIGIRIDKEELAAALERPVDTPRRGIWRLEGFWSDPSSTPKLRRFSAYNDSRRHPPCPLSPGLMQSVGEQAIWLEVTRDGNDLFLCQVCQDGRARAAGHRSRHEATAAHQSLLPSFLARSAPSEDPAPTHPGDRIMSDDGLRHLLSSLSHGVVAPYPDAAANEPPPGVGINWNLMEATGDGDLSLSADEQAVASISAAILERYTELPLSDDEFEERSDDEEQAPNEPEVSVRNSDEPDAEDVRPRKRTRTDNHAATSQFWYPWPDRITCTLDILMHLPRSVFSHRQLDLFLWLLKVNNVDDVPSVKSMQTINLALQKMCGIESIPYDGALGHKYYVNSLAQIIAQEMANPKVRPHLHFYPEDSGPKLSEARQAQRWLTELPDERTTPMARISGKDYYIHEPSMLSNGDCVIPVRWFMKDGELHAKCWQMHVVVKEDAAGWRVYQPENFVVPATRFLMDFVTFQNDVGRYNLPHPSLIVDVVDSATMTSKPWRYTNPVIGNRWRSKAEGHRVVMFPIWMYCDDTSGNVSKKWNEHNSFLVTPAGLPREESQREYNIHFLSTSNLARPLEMLDGIVEQLEEAQEEGIWAWDMVEEEPVLVIRRQAWNSGQASGKRGIPAKQAALDAKKSQLPSNTISPVWRIKGLDPHQDTPVEILHVILLGFVKYLWRDVVQLQLNKKDDKKQLLATRLSSLDVSGLGISPLAGRTLVQYSGSLTGRDFRAIAQVAPFVIYDLVSEDCFQTWQALSKLVPLIWQPEIKDVESHIALLTKEIEHFLLCAAKWTNRWFNKPKFHIFVHLPAHIRRFGPAILFATEAFESFNAIIRAKSVHSNRHAPSRDIAHAFAQGNRIRHLISGGLFMLKVQPALDVLATATSATVQLAEAATPVSKSAKHHWGTVGPGPQSLVAAQSTVTSYLGLNQKKKPTGDICTADKRTPRGIKDTVTGLHLAAWATKPGLFRTMIVQDPLTIGETFVARVEEIIQQMGSPAALSSSPDGVLIQRASIDRIRTRYGMPSITFSNQWSIHSTKDLLCTVNVQHNCIDNECGPTGSKVVYQERAKTNQTRLEIAHTKNVQDIVLNTAQMRDAIHLQPFRVQPDRLDFD